MAAASSRSTQVRQGGLQAQPGYSAAKFGGVGLTQSLALDLAEHNITVHS